MTENLQNETTDNDLQQIDLLALEAAANDGDPVPGAEVLPAAAVSVPTLGEEIAGTVTAVVLMLTPAFPSLKAVYPPEVVGALGESVADVCKKYGWLQDGLMGEYQAEITCACLCIPLAISTRAAIMHDLAARKPKPAEQKAANDEAPATSDGQAA